MNGEKFTMHGSHSNLLRSLSILGGLACVIAGVAGIVSCKPVGDPTWDNPVDQNGSNYHLPTVVLHDTDIRDPNGVVVPHGASLNSVIREYRWQMEGENIGTTSGPLSVAGWRQGLHNVSVQAADGNGLVSSVALVKVWIGNRPPILSVIRDTMLPVNTSVLLRLSARDTDGTIAYYSWDTAASGFRNLTTTGVVEITPNRSGVINLNWKAVDNDSGVSISTIHIGFIPAPRMVSAVVDTNVVAWNGSHEKGKLVMNWVGNIPGFPSENITWELYAENSEGVVKIYSGLASSDSLPNVEPGRTYQYKLVGKNRFGDSCSASGSVVASNRIVSAIDSRDNQIYGCTQINHRTWMSKNLNFAADSSWCYGNNPVNCNTYGRLYRSAVALDTVLGPSGMLANSTTPRKGVCPVGWHVPSYDEWNTMISYADTSNNHASLKSTTGWYQNYGTGQNGNGTDLFGFHALPAGHMEPEGNFSRIGYSTHFWSSGNSDFAISWADAATVDVLPLTIYKNYRLFAMSVRCIKNQ